MKKIFKNWMGNVKDTPKAYLEPSNEEEIVAIVQKALKESKKIRVVGSGHSWSPLVPGGDLLLSLDQWQGIVSIDETNQVAEVKAGTKIWRLGKLLHEKGWGMENFGDINRQSIAGAMSTGTHGSGLGLGTLSTQAVGFTLVTGKGEIVECSAQENPNLFKAAQVSMGLLGIITKIKIRIIPAQVLKAVKSTQNLDNTLAHIGQHLQNRHFEFYWFPGTKYTYHKTMNVTDEPAKALGWKHKFQDIFIENYLLWVICRIVKLFPSLAKRVSNFSGKVLKDGLFINYNHLLLSQPRLVTFTDWEFAFPVEKFAEVVKTMEAVMAQKNLKEHFPLVCRFVKGDDIPLSPAYGRDTAYISFHTYAKRKNPEYLEHLEQVVKSFGGRPHWGKFHTYTTQELQALYPQWQVFMTIREQIDPQQIFVNDYLEKLLDIKKLAAVS
ncbi:MAG TPA: FAD-binding oxidoreductase [Microscillaceae bacterium]|nr:FAD-binding oxidoreductase [Microscillaceae bacterium]